MKIFATFSIIFGFFLIFYNCIAFYRIFFKRHNISWIPLIGGGFMAMGLYILDEHWWWVAFLIDLGCLFGFSYNFLLNRWIDPIVIKYHQKNK